LGAWISPAKFETGYSENGATGRIAPQRTANVQQQLKLFPAPRLKYDRNITELLQPKSMKTIK
jgi:hypothetical protein